MEYSNRKRITKREEFLNKMVSVVPWKEWVAMIQPIYLDGKCGRRPQDIEKMLRMMLQTWFNLSDEGIEDGIYDSYAMRCFMGIDFDEEQVPDATTLCKFRKLLVENEIYGKLFYKFKKFSKKKTKLCMMEQ